MRNTIMFHNTKKKKQNKKIQNRDLDVSPQNVIFFPPMGSSDKICFHCPHPLRESINENIRSFASRINK